MRALLTALILFVPGCLAAQSGYVGILGGRTATELTGDSNYFGSLAGGFLQVDMTPHVGFRSEAYWARTGALSRRDLSSCQDCLWQPQPVGLSYAEVNAIARLTWRADSLFRRQVGLGLAVFGGGWLGARLTGRVAPAENRVGDFGHLVGLGLFYARHRLLLEVDARSYHGERSITPGGANRRGSQLVMGIGYRIHKEENPSPPRATSRGR